MIDDIKDAKPGEWFSKLDQGKSDTIQAQEISHLSDKDQAERISDKQAEISNIYKEVSLSAISIFPLNPRISLS